MYTVNVCELIALLINEGVVYIHWKHYIVHIATTNELDLVVKEHITLVNALILISCLTQLVSAFGCHFADDILKCNFW